MGIRCFLLAQTDRAELSLRRFCFSQRVIDGKVVELPGSKCPGPMGSHDASADIGVEEVVWSVCGEEDDHRCYAGVTTHVDHADPHWPVKCDSCPYVFQDEDEWQVNHRLLHTRSDGGPQTTLRKAPVGAMWFADWMGKFNRGPDGHCLVVKVPGKLPSGVEGHEWCVDSRASNCTMPDDTEHRCWVRHGNPPDVTVDKNGRTCAAGAGSIAVPGWHGFLRNGELVE